MKTKCKSNSQIMHFFSTQWIWLYNNEQPHSSIGGMPPRKLLEAI